MNTLKSLASVWTLLAINFGANPQSLRTFERRYEGEGLQFLTTILPSLGKDLDRSLSTGKLEITGRFKLKRNTGLPVFLFELFIRVFDKDGYLKEYPEGIKQLRQLLLMMYKYKVDFTPEMELKAYAEFIELDESVKTDSWPSTIGDVKRHFMSLFPDDPLDIRPHHSGGATADRIKNSQKRRVRRIIPALDRLYGPKYFFNTENHAKAWYRDNRLMISNPSARLTLVQKDSRGPRKICMEPHERMFVQKGLMQKIYDFVESSQCPAYGYVNFTNQVTNRRLAALGSLDQRYSTIDLKDASDLVSWELVKILAPLSWTAALSATRSCRVELPELTVVLNKFAPMGSALCFPIEAMLFWSIARTVTDEVWVFGDDIIVGKAYAHDVMSALESYGLAINHEKSLTTGFFRESCGGEFYRGEDISITRLKSMDVESYVTFCNLITEKYCEEISRLLIGIADSLVEGTIIRREPIDQLNRAEPLVYYTSYTSGNVLLQRRFSSKLHRYEIRSLSVVSTVAPDPQLNDYDAYFEWLTLSNKESSPDEARISHALELEFGDGIWPKPKGNLTDSFKTGSINSWALNSKIKFRWTGTQCTGGTPT